jgi:hypothetical protein
MEVTKIIFTQMQCIEKLECLVVSVVHGSSFPTLIFGDFTLSRSYTDFGNNL